MSRLLEQVKSWRPDLGCPCEEMEQIDSLLPLLREALPMIRTALELAAARPSALDMCEATHTALDMLSGLEMAVEEVGE